MSTFKEYLGRDGASESDKSFLKDYTMKKQTLFKEHTEAEKRVFREWARDNYKPFDPISPVWHPTTQTECRKISEEIKDALEKHWGENFIGEARKLIADENLQVRIEELLPSPTTTPK